MFRRRVAQLCRPSDFELEQCFPATVQRKAGFFKSTSTLKTVSEKFHYRKCFPTSLKRKVVVFKSVILKSVFEKFHFDGQFTRIACSVGVWANR